MNPILFQTMTEGTVPTNYGLGVLDAMSCVVKEERNGAFELAMTYAANGIHAEDIQPNRFIMAKPNYTEPAQIFRIYKVGKTINGKFTVNAQHISYDLSGKIITTGTASSCVAACALLQAQAGGFTIDTDKTVTANFNIYAPASVRSYFGGKQGSLLDIYGGEWKYNNYTASLKQARGADRSVVIRYEKNLTELSQQLDMSNLVTGIVPYYIDPNGNKTVGAKVSTGLTLDVTRDVAIDFSTDVDPESSTAIATQLANLANAYKNSHNLTTLTNSITLDFVQSGQLTERVDLCDTVHIYFEALGITATAKCIATTWDVLEGRYTSTTFGEARTNIADTIAQASQTLASTPSRSYMAEAIAHATELITGNLGGYVILHDSDGDGEPDEILIMNTADITTATQVWRWNKNGLGYATSYAGPYGTAITADGKIVADFVTTGTLNANLIKAGTISDTNNRSSISMTSGEATLYKLKAKDSFELVTVNGVKKASLSHLADGSWFQLYEPDTTTPLVRIWASGSNGSINLRNASGYNTVEAGNSIVQVNGPTTGNTRGKLFVAGSGAGVLSLSNSSEVENILIAADTGNVRCVSLTQTSSRKVKENIKPIEDAEKVLELDAVEFDYKDKNQGVNKRGFIAEDVAEVLPNLVTPETETTPATLDYIGIIPYLQAVIKKQEERIKALEDKLNGTN